MKRKFSELEEDCVAHAEAVKAVPVPSPPAEIQPDISVLTSTGTEDEPSLSNSVPKRRKVGDLVTGVLLGGAAVYLALGAI